MRENQPFTMAQAWQHQQGAADLQGPGVKVCKSCWMSAAAAQAVADFGSLGYLQLDAYTEQVQQLVARAELWSGMPPYATAPDPAMGVYLIVYKVQLRTGTPDPAMPRSSLSTPRSSILQRPNQTHADSAIWARMLPYNVMWRAG